MLAAILFIAFAAFIFKPVAGLEQAVVKMECCSKNSCAKHDQQPEKKDCGNNGCNMISCALCNYYMPVTAEIHFTLPSAKKKEVFSFNDHRLYFISSDCWHPPKQTEPYTA
jgi:hypothetical protein